MKKNLFCLIIVTFIMCSVTFAQPTITATGTNSVIGESFNFNSASYVSPGNSGANQTWDLSSMSGTPTLTTVIAPSTTANASSFTNANVAWSYASGGISYYKTSSSAYQNYGVVSGSIVMAYTNPEDLMHFPFTYNNTYTDTWATTFVNGGYTFYRTGSTTVTADGYGTLTTPAGTYTNALRIHFVETYQDSTNVGGPYLIQYSNDEYMWYKDGSHYPIATVYTLTENGTPTTGGAYMSSSVGINESSALLSSADLFPNPASSKITLNYTLTKSQKVDVYLYNSIGEKLDISQTAYGIEGENNLQIDIAKLPEGIYFAQILLNDKIASAKRFVITK